MTLVWNKPTDPENDPVFYRLYLNDILLEENLTTQAYNLIDLKILFHEKNHITDLS